MNNYQFVQYRKRIESAEWAEATKRSVPIQNVSFMLIFTKTEGVIRSSAIVGYNFPSFRFSSFFQDYLGLRRKGGCSLLET